MCARLCSVNKWAMVVILVFGGTLLATAPYGGGTGEPNDPYLIYTAEQMNAIGANPADWDSHFKLMADIDLSGFTGTQFHIIGTGYSYRFTGVFDGNGHTISNFTYATSGPDCAGLFGCVHANDAEVKNLGLINPRVTASNGSDVGALVGYFQGTITNCYTRGGSVSGNGAVGGLVGDNSSGAILNSYSTSAVKGAGNGVGGLVGSHSGTIANCYATGAVTGNDTVGGLVGSNSGEITGCYSTGAVVALSGFAGGLVGWGSHIVTGSFWDAQTSGRTLSYGGGARTSAEMRDPGTFRAAGWDFFGAADGPSDIWAIDAETGYPILWWQVPQDQLPRLPSFSGGCGTRDDPYWIASAEQLNRIGHNPRLMTAHFRLVDDIDLAQTELWAIGDTLFPFTGDFDGNSRAISNLTYRYDRADLVGLFRYVSGVRAMVRNLILINPKIDLGTGYGVGSLVGSLHEGTIKNCHIQGARVSGTGQVGGLVGDNYGTVRDCSVEAVVTGANTLGGLAGSALGVITNCQVAGTVTGRGSSIGGVAGDCAGTIANCSASCTVTGGRHHTGGVAGFVQGGVLINCYISGGSVSGDSQVGGLIGFLNTGDVWNCYSTCPVSGKTKVGGLIGSTSIGSVSSSFWNIETSGQTASDGGTGKTSIEMKDPNTFIRTGWDFFGSVNGPSDIWTFDSGAQRPVLWWQVPPEQWPELPLFSGGTGTREDPYLIASAAQLSRIGHNPRLMEYCFKLSNDVSLAGTTFFPLGGLAAPFRARFDGDNHTVSHLTYVRTDGSHVGLLGLVEGVDAQIKNLKLTGPHVDAGDWPYGDAVGALVGRLGRGTLQNCSVEGGSVSGDHSVGALVGSVAYGILRNCHATSTVRGDGETGGLIGECSKMVITDCYATGSVTASDAGAGGLIGESGAGTIRNCSATGRVTSGGAAGGLVGYSFESTLLGCRATGAVSGGNFAGGLLGAGSRILIDCHATGNVSGKEEAGGLTGSNSGAVRDCYATGAVAGTSSVGGLVGENFLGPIDHCYAAGAVSGQSNVGGLVGYSWEHDTIAYCRATGPVTGRTNVGGLMGYNGHQSRISDCYATGAVSGEVNVGGLVGRNGEIIDITSVHRELPGFIANCYSSGRVSGGTQTGGLVGFHHCGSVTASFWDTQTSGQAASAGGTGKTTADMWIAQTFLDAGWDLAGEAEEGDEHVWWIREGQDYPRLWWERDME